MTEPSAAASCWPQVFTSCTTLLSGVQVHPLEPIAPKDCEFVVISPKVQLRVIHVHPEGLRKSLQEVHLHHAHGHGDHSKRSSLSEEYWFTKWNKPLKMGNCNCSFRRSMRFSGLSNQAPVPPKQDSFDVTPTKIVNVETFVERLIQETVFEAYQEYYMAKSTPKEEGTINLAYKSSEDDDDVVKLRNKLLQTNGFPSKPHCTHKKQLKKPVILLLHGIGCTADVWWMVMNTLLAKGYEVVAPDLLGHGFSTAPTKSSCYSFQNLLLQILAIFDHYIDDKKTCIVIGHSYGCSLATALYQLRPLQITQLVLISGGGPTPLAAPVKENEISPFGCIHSLLRPLLFCGVKRSLFYSSRGKHFKPCNEDNAIPGHVLDSIANGQNWPQGDAAFHRRILVPTLLVHGLQDKNVTLVQGCEMERTMPRAFLELIPNAGHMAMLETPEHLTHMIMCFLDWWN